MTPKHIPTLEVALVRKSQMFRALVEKENKHQIGLLIYHWKDFEVHMLKFLHIVHLHLICMSYDQKKGRESTWEFDS